ncbi:MAG: hypothetical protein GOV15_00455 [Candidatus Diapherotrites archaeon]|nr:hypothetical protein [Candidatus Diapherotrites archaeon]
MPSDNGIRSLVFLGLIALVIGGSYLLFAGADLFGSAFYNNAALILIALLILIFFSNSDFLLKLKEYQRAVTYRMGKFTGVKGPGWILMIPGIDDYTLVDTRTQTLDIPKEDVITKEKVELQIDTVIYITVKDAERAILTVTDYKDAVKQFVIGALRDIVGTMTVDDVISNVEDINKFLEKRTKEMSEKWGVEVNVEMKDVDIPKALLEAMHDAQAAEKKADAIRTIAEADAHKIKAIRSATEGMNDKSLVFYYMEALKALASGRASKLIVPMELTQLANVFSGLRSPPTPATQLTPDVENLIHKYAKVLKETGVPETVKPKASKTAKRKAVDALFDEDEPKRKKKR